MTTGAVEVLGVLPYASNYTFLAKVSIGAEELLAVYKPRRGERPLWDFPQGTLARREVAAFVVSEAAGFGLVPPTVLRLDAPLGDGSLQLFVNHDPERHYFALVEERLDDFRALAAFDVVINNADRKGGHVIEDTTGKLRALDHGVTFHAEPKLRTVIWEFAEQALDEQIIEHLERLRSALRGATPVAEQLKELLSPGEVAALERRVVDLLRAGHFPPPDNTRHPLPWPLV